MTILNIAEIKSALHNILSLDDGLTLLSDRLIEVLVICNVKKVRSCEVNVFRFRFHDQKCIGKLS
jgi:hypothetical protein